MMRKRIPIAAQAAGAEPDVDIHPCSTLARKAQPRSCVSTGTFTGRRAILKIRPAARRPGRSCGRACALADAP
jgi:hypothetical protein